MQRDPAAEPIAAACPDTVMLTYACGSWKKSARGVTGAVRMTSLSLTEEQVGDVLWAARAGDVDALNETVQAIRPGADSALADVVRACANDAHNTVLHYSAANGHEEFVRYVLPHADLRLLLRQNSAGNTALHWAALNGHVAVCGALVDRIDELETQDTEVAKELRAAEDERETKRHASSTAKDAESVSKEEAAAERKRHEEQQHHRALWDVRNEMGHGPMTEAQMGEQEGVVQLLLRKLSKNEAGEEPSSEPAKEEELPEKTQEMRLS